MDKIKILFTFEGRINRLTFIAYQFIIAFGIYLISFLASNIHQILGIIIGAITMVAWLWSAISLSCRRAHDLGISGWFGLLILIPLLNLLLFILPGNKEENRFGCIPEHNSKIIITFASIAILFATVPFIFGLLATAPSPDSSWAYSSYCNDPDHSDIHKIFNGKESGLKQCSNFSNNHFDEYKGHKNVNDESHSAGCKLVEAPFPWSLSID